MLQNVYLGIPSTTINWNASKYLCSNQLFMNDKVEFNFGNESIAQAYDTILVPSLFEPWAIQIIQDNMEWAGLCVLDLACGTGVVTKELAHHVNPNGGVTALDINRQMLDLAKLKCAEWDDHIEFIEGSAESIAISDNTFDIVVCQQGFQFFPNKNASAKEIQRVLKSGGKAIISTWCSVSECEIFGAICESLEFLDEINISKMMRVPFDNISQEELKSPFVNAEFSSVTISRQEKDLYLKGGLDRAIDMAYATPIGPKLKELSRGKQERFKEVFSNKVKMISRDGSDCGRMTTNVLNAFKRESL